MSRPKPVVLYVDDDPDYRAAVRAILEAHGYEMLEAGTGEEGLDAFRGRQPDVVLVDLMMEEVDSGTNLVKELKLLGSHVPIFMLSSVGENMNLTADPAALGLAGVFQKPIDGETLVAVLDTALHR